MITESALNSLSGAGLAGLGSLQASWKFSPWQKDGISWAVPADNWPPWQRGWQPGSPGGTWGAEVLERRNELKWTNIWF